ncbi:competence/damage-inducible protein A [Lichenicoccus roseus]|uniref:Competence/damage-inducible protein A n=1 Tax=Lichenicoccus roseus TaxID=2683649 RepID=A0A5R9J437_9PROT|nr:molybdopterin-binding protein [Lichenicoccus roseus]TLU72380.1 competence/damage-inducible protein A [Lichenicoccus roseus]
MNPTACILVIGNEILSGRTQDANVQFLARRLGQLGISLREVRVIPDVSETIVGTIVELRARYDHLLTTGGIGPTHDDITSACVAEAFGVPWEIHPDSFAKLEAYMAPGSFNAARQRMAMLPRGATPIDNPVSVAPGYSIGNVHVMAGVPRIMRAMFENLAPSLAGGRPVVSLAWHADGMLEGAIAEGLEAIQRRMPAVEIGSYPYERPDRRGVSLVSKGIDADAVAEAGVAVRALIAELGYTPVQGEPPSAQPGAAAGTAGS